MKTSPATAADAANYTPDYKAIGYPRWGTDGGDSEGDN